MDSFVDKAFIVDGPEDGSKMLCLSKAISIWKSFSEGVIITFHVYGIKT